jgi:hypothetical protein
MNCDLITIPNCVRFMTESLGYYRSPYYTFDDALKEDTDFFIDLRLETWSKKCDLLSMDLYERGKLGYKLKYNPP